MKLFRTMEVMEDTFKVGDVIDFTLNDGEEVEALAVKQEQDGMIFVLVDCLRKEYAMNRTNTNRGGYEQCALRGKLNGEILDRFPAESVRRWLLSPTVISCACPPSVRFSALTPGVKPRMKAWSSGSL